MRRAIHTDQAPAAVGPYSQAVLDEATGLLFCSGQIGIDPRTQSLVTGGTEAEFRQALANVRAVLAAASCSIEDVIKTTIFLADIADFAVVNRLYAEVFREPYPARSTLQAAALPKGARIELDVIARSSGAATRA